MKKTKEYQPTSGVIYLGRVDRSNPGNGQGELSTYFNGEIPAKSKIQFGAFGRALQRGDLVTFKLRRGGREPALIDQVVSHGLLTPHMKP